MLEFQPIEPHNVTIFREKVFKGMIRMKLVGGVLIQYGGVLIGRGNLGTQRGTRDVHILREGCTYMQ